MQSQESTKLDFDCQPMDCAFHPSQRVVAASLIDGGIRILDCSGSQPREMQSVKRHQESCRSLEFSELGDRLISGSADNSVMVLDSKTGKSIFGLKRAHESPVERILPTGATTFASGDEEGLIRTWDWRAKAHTAEYSSHRDFISDMAFLGSENCVVSVGGDGSLSINDMKTQKVQETSNASEELTAVAVLKHGKQIVCGTQVGVLNIYSRDQISNCNDKMPGHPMSIDAILKLDEDTIITGSSDGMARVLSVQPHRLLGMLAEQEDGGCERMALSSDQQLLAVAGLGSLVLWDTSCLVDSTDDSTDQPTTDQEDESTEQRPPKRRQKENFNGSSTNVRPAKKSDNFFQDLLS